MRHRQSSVVLALSGIASSAIAQTTAQHVDRPWDIYARSTDADACITPSEELIAALPYDGASTYAAKAQDFESDFDQYDIFIIEDIAPAQDAALGEFRSVGFATGNPFGTEDVVVRIFEDDGSGLPGSDSYTGELVLTSTPGAGFYNGLEWITDFGGQCLSAGSYYIVFHARMDFVCCGGSFFYLQSGESSFGGGDPDNAWFWNPADAFGLGIHFPIIDFGTGERSGINYLLFGEPADCPPPPCPNDPTGCGDWDEDGDSDGDDFFGFLDAFANGSECADLDGDGDRDGDDFFGFLDNFINDC